MLRRAEPISLAEAETLTALFQQRVHYSADVEAYHFFDEPSKQWQSITWKLMAHCVQQWQNAMQREGLQAGDRVAIMLANSPRWVMFDQAALALGLIVVPLYIADNPENIAYILQHSGAKLLLLNGPEQWQRLQGMRPQLNGLVRVLSVKPVQDPRSSNLIHLEAWLNGQQVKPRKHQVQAHDVASIVYTSGTTGHPKGVMLTHDNMLYNAWAGMEHIRVYCDDRFLSFLPLSHTLERTIGYYLPMMAGAQVAYARSITTLSDDLKRMQPTILITVPRIFERVYEKMHQRMQQQPAVTRRLFEQAVTIGWQDFLHQQGQAAWSPKLLFTPIFHLLFGRPLRQALGGRLRFAISGGAALNPQLSRTFLALGIAVQQGYGLTENGPVISVNPLQGNKPASVGTALTGMEIRVDAQQQLWVRGRSVMQGYWNNPQATEEVLQDDGWLKTGDVVRCDDDGYIHIIGRLKDIIVLSNGEKLCPEDMETMMSLEPTIDQAVLIGEGRPYLAALIVPSEDEYQRLQQAYGETWHRHPEAIKQTLHTVQQATREFPGYAKIRRVHLCPEPWSIENHLLTPTMKQRRAKIISLYQSEIECLYQR